MSKQVKPKGRAGKSAADTSRGASSSSRAPRVEPRNESATAVEKINELSLATTRPFSLESYELFAKVLKVIDGDTIVLGFFLFRNKWNARCRCAGFNCAEMRAESQNERDAAIRARDHVSQLLLDKIVKVQFEADDKYGRPIVNITLPDGRDLCQVMISGGYAAAYKGRGEKRYC